jgi:hypothetical protein
VQGYGLIRSNAKRKQKEREKKEKKERENKVFSSHWILCK